MPNVPETPQTADSGAPRREGFNLSAVALRYRQVTLFFLLICGIGGALAFFSLGQREDPDYTFRAMVVRTLWPGATAQQVDELVTDRIEKTVQEIPYFKYTTSYSKPGESLVVLMLKDSSPPDKVKDYWYQVRKKIGDIRYRLPPAIQGPFFNDEFGDVFGTIYAMTGDGIDMARLRRYAEDVRDQLLHVPDVAKVELVGVQPEQIHVTLSATRLAQLGLTPEAIAREMQAQNLVASAGTLHTDARSVRLNVSGQFDNVKAVQALRLTVGGRIIRLGDIATVTRGYQDPATMVMRYQGRDAIGIAVSMVGNGDVLQLGRNLDARMRELHADLPVGVEFGKVSDQPKVVEGAVDVFTRSLLEAVIIVLAVSLLSLGLRAGMVVALSIPLVLAATFLGMKVFGIDLHRVSTGALIIALGLLVDDAMISIEMMARKLEEGLDTFHAATYAYTSTAFPMLTGTLITAVGFLPIGIARSTVGEYTFAIFAVTVIALLVSWVASVLFVPLLGVWLLKTPPHVAQAQAQGRHDEHHDNFDTPFYRAFARLVAWCVRHRWLTLAATAFVFALGLAGMGRVQQQFFPDSTRPEMLIELWQPEGASFAASEATAVQVEQRLLQEADVKGVSQWIGSGVPRFYLPLNQLMPQSNVAQFIVLPHDLNARGRLLKSLPALLAAEFPQVRARVTLLSSGPPVPYPVQFRIIGPNPEQLRHYASEVKALMRANPHMRDVNDNWNESVKTLRLQIDQDKARALGVSSQSIAQALHIMQNGAAVGQYREGDKLIDITLRQPASERGTLGSLEGAYVTTASGRAIPLAQIATPVFAWEPGVLWRFGREYAITAQGDISEGMQGATVTAALLPALRELEARWAVQTPGYRIEVAGAVEESNKGSSSIAAGLPLMLFLTFTLLMLQLQSFSRALLVFLTGPLGIAGVAAALLALGRPFGFVALLGVIALMGMIQRNSVILIDQIELNRSQGAPAAQAIVTAAVGRLRPIALTAAAAVLAMIPLSRSAFWGPMAVAIMGGLIVATALTLLALPAMYAAWFKVPADGLEDGPKNDLEHPPAPA